MTRERAEKGAERPVEALTGSVGTSVAPEFAMTADGNWHEVVAHDGGPTNVDIRVVLTDVAALIRHQGRFEGPRGKRMAEQCALVVDCYREGERLDMDWDPVWRPEVVE